MKNKFADLDRQMAKALRAAEKGVRASQRDLLYQIRKSLDDIYRRYGKEGKLTMDEMRKYKRMRKLEAEIAKTVKNHRQEADKIIKSLLRYSTLKSIEACVDRNTLKPTRVKAIKARIDVDKIINETVGGRNWLERTRRIEGNVAYDIISEVRAGIDQGISYHEMAANIDKAMGKYNGRPETIARTETHRVIETSKNDAMVEVNKEIPQMKIWRNAGDEKVRSTHEAMEGQKVPFNEPFELPSGAKTMYPGESGIASEDINCRCIVEYVDATPEEIKEMNADENAEKLDSSGEKEYNEDIPNELKSFNLNLDVGKQNNHIFGTNEFKQRIKNGIEPSYFNEDAQKIEKIGRQLIGTGVLIADPHNKNLYREIVDTRNKLNGVAVNNLNGKKVKTSVATIKYNKDKGWHMYPDYPSKMRGGSNGKNNN